MNKTLITKVMKVVALPITISALLVGCSDGGSDIIASVNGEKIAKEELTETLTAQYGVEVLDTLISNKIVELEAKELSVSVNEEEIESEYEEYAEAYGGTDALISMLEAYGMDEESIKKEIEDYLLSIKVMEEYVAITDEEVETYFEENKANYATEEQVKASHILVDDKETANEVIDKINNGEDFAEMAKEYSTDTATSENGGSLGYFGKGEMAEAFEEAAFTLDIDKISEPVETEYGFHVIKVTDHVQAEEPRFKEIKDTVYQNLLKEKVNEQFSTWIAEKTEEYEIENKLID